VVLWQQTFKNHKARNDKYTLLSRAVCNDEGVGFYVECTVVVLPLPKILGKKAIVAIGVPQDRYKN
jgi:hypothetical protein